MLEPSGQRLGAYRLVRRIGRGGMGEVWLGQHLKLGREAAIKVLPANLAGEADFLKRFEREASSAASLTHPNILPVWDYGEQDGTPYLVMPYVGSGALKDRLRDGPLRPHAIEHYLRQMVGALDYAHSRGLIHRDVKPANMLVDEHDQLYLADFGIAKALEGTEGLTRTGVGIGTPEYMAPEQAQGRADTRSDLYALGIVLYQMLTGRVPFSGSNSVEVLMKHVQEAMPVLPLRDVASPEVAEMLRKVLAKNPDERYQSGAALLEAYREAAARVGPRTQVQIPQRTPLGDATLPRAVTPVPSWPPGHVATPAWSQGQTAPLHSHGDHYGHPGTLEPPLLVGGVATGPHGQTAVAPAPRRLGWLVPAVVAVVLLLLAGGGATLALSRSRGNGVTPVPTGVPSPVSGSAADLSSWEIVTVPGLARTYYDAATAEFHIQLLQNKSSRAFYAPDGAMVTDFKLAVDARRASGPDTSGYGIMFRRQPGVGYYYFYVWVDGNFSLALVREDGSQEVIQAPRQSDYISLGDSTNRLGLEVQGSRVTIAINDTPIGTYPLTVTGPGQIGLAALAPADGTPGDPGIDAAFSNLTLSSSR